MAPACPLRPGWCWSRWAPALYNEDRGGELVVESVSRIGVPKLP
jgi:hypothetical protein